jgi:hypothetical protein
MDVHRAFAFLASALVDNAPPVMAVDASSIEFEAYLVEATQMVGNGFDKRPELKVISYKLIKV